MLVAGVNLCKCIPTDFKKNNKQKTTTTKYFPLFVQLPVPSLCVLCLFIFSADKILSCISHAKRQDAWQYLYLTPGTMKIFNPVLTASKWEFIYMYLNVHISLVDKLTCCNTNLNTSKHCSKLSTNGKLN